jgi:CRP-like cAMP-binding protein
MTAEQQRDLELSLDDRASDSSVVLASRIRDAMLNLATGRIEDAVKIAILLAEGARQEDLADALGITRARVREAMTELERIAPNLLVD